MIGIGIFEYLVGVHDEAIGQGENERERSMNNRKAFTRVRAGNDRPIRISESTPGHNHEGGGGRPLHEHEGIAGMSAIE
jgi:hypothetical protein